MTSCFLLARDANKRGWWEDYPTEVISDGYRAFISLEAEAASIMLWQVDIVPGLLQTEAYARQVIEGYQEVVKISPTTVDRRVSVRMIRQQVLTSKPPPELSAVIDESVLLRRIGRREVMYEQLHHLAKVADRPNVQLRVIPLATESSLRTASFEMFSFGHRTGELRDIVCTEGVETEMYIEDDPDTYHHRLVFQGLVKASLSPVDSQNLIQETAEHAWA